MIWFSLVHTAGPCLVGEVHASKPASWAIIRALYECVGSLTRTTESPPWSSTVCATASRLPTVLVPVSTARITVGGTPRWELR